MKEDTTFEPRSTAAADLDVTVIVPTHNRLEHLKRALRSVRDQRHQPVSLVVVDDVGDHSVRSFVERFDSNFTITYVDASARAEKTAGASRNDGARLAASDWLAFLDDDDHWSPEFLERAATDIGITDADVWSCNAYIEFEGKQLRDWQRPQANWTKRGLPAGGMSGSNIVIARTLFHKVGGYDASLPVWNDLDFELRIRLADARIVVSEENLVGADADGGEHLTSASERRARGLATFLQKNRSATSLADRRRIRAAIHSSYAHISERRAKRIFHRFVQATNTTPVALLRQLAGGGHKPFR